jgi:hypothetical protein
MAFVFHIHTSPSCETTHSTSCVSIDGSNWDHSCFQIASGRNRGKCACVHRNPEGLSHEEEIFISDLISLNVFARDQGGYRKENRA